jgi:hypothetical protein
MDVAPTETISHRSAREVSAETDAASSATNKTHHAAGFAAMIRYVSSLDGARQAHAWLMARL